MNHSELEAIVGFLRAIGLTVRESPLGEDTFLPGVTVEDGAILFDPVRLLWPADLLHEAGHLAVTPAADRTSQSGNLRALALLPAGGEVEAIAWSYAAALHLGLSADTLFHSDGYRGNSASLILSFQLGVFPGLPGLIQIGLAVNSRTDPERAYPKMLKWLRD